MAVCTQITFYPTRQYQSPPDRSLHCPYFIHGFVPFSPGLPFSDIGQAPQTQRLLTQPVGGPCVSVSTEFTHWEVKFDWIHHLFTDFCLHILYFLNILLPILWLSPFSPSATLLLQPLDPLISPSHPPPPLPLIPTAFPLFPRLTWGSSARAFCLKTCGGN